MAWATAEDLPWRFSAIVGSFAGILLLLFLGLTTLYVGDIMCSRKARLWMYRTYTQIIQDIFPESISLLVGIFWWALSLPSPVALISVARTFSGWCDKAVWYYRSDKVRGYCALTIDDAPGRGEPLMEQVLALLEEFDVKCTFFVVSNYMDRHMDFLEECVSRGHELANHGGDDIPYHRHSRSEFQKVLEGCQERIRKVYSAVGRTEGEKWFRPPQGKMSATMDTLLTEQGYRIAMCDCWAMDVLCGADFVEKYTLAHAKDGSILLVHMPEVGFRDWTLVALRGILAGLKQRNIKCVTLSHLDALANGTADTH